MELLLSDFSIWDEYIILVVVISPTVCQLLFLSCFLYCTLTFAVLATTALSFALTAYSPLDRTLQTGLFSHTFRLHCLLVDRIHLKARN